MNHTNLNLIKTYFDPYLDKVGLRATQEEFSA